MSELHRAFLTHLQKYWQKKLGSQHRREIYYIRKGVKLIEKMIYAGSSNINEKDQDGNTLLHLIFDTQNDTLKHVSERAVHYDQPCWRLIDAILKNGGNLTIKNNKNLTPLDIYFSHEKHGISFDDLIFLIKDFHLNNKVNDGIIIRILDGIIYKFPDKDFADFLFFINELPLETLKSILIWSSKIKNHMMATKLKEQLDGQIRLLELAPDLPDIIDELANSSGTKRATIFRAMLLAGKTPLADLLYQIINDEIFSHIHRDKIFKIISFVNEYEQKRVLLEELSAIPIALTETELKLISPICDKLNFILYNLQEPNSDKEWQKRVGKIDKSAQHRMQERYTQYQNEDRIKQAQVFSELRLHQTSIQNGTYLGVNGFFEKNKFREKMANATEKRIQTAKI